MWHLKKILLLRICNFNTFYIALRLSLWNWIWKWYYLLVFLSLFALQKYNHNLSFFHLPTISLIILLSTQMILERPFILILVVWQFYQISTIYSGHHSKQLSAASNEQQFFRQQKNCDETAFVTFNLVINPITVLQHTLCSLWKILINSIIPLSL